MPKKLVENPRLVLERSKVILLIDWPSPEVPRALLKSGFKVFCYSPNGYTRAEIVAEYPEEVNQQDVFPPKNKGEGYLIFYPVPDSPGKVDIVNIYRPGDEHAKIIADHVIPLGAKCIWLQAPVCSAEARLLAEQRQLIFIEGYDIAEIARQLAY